jgi:signal transduction histidine kinase
MTTSHEHGRLSLPREAVFEELAEEQASLRRVATLVAAGIEPDDLFTAVSDEVTRLFGSTGAGVGRFEPDGAALVVVGVSEGLGAIAVGMRVPLDDWLASTEVYRTGRAARREQSGDEVAGPGAVADTLRAMQLYSAVAAPIVVEGALWGVLMAVSEDVGLPPQTEERLEKFGELVATAIANAESRAELAASEERARALGEEQAALRRVATLVARGVSPAEIFSAVSVEVAGLFGSVAGVARFDPDGFLTVVDITRGFSHASTGSRMKLADSPTSAEVYRTGRTARTSPHESIRGTGLLEAVSAPIIVEGHLWGVIGVSAERLPPDTEERVEKFTELVATAIANADSRTELAAAETRARALAEEQAALGRVATLVARGVDSGELFSTVSKEVALLFAADGAAVCRLESGGSELVALGLSEGLKAIPIGIRVPLDDSLATATVAKTGRAARKDLRSSPRDAAARVHGAMVGRLFQSSVAAPIVVEGNLWGAIVTLSTSTNLPADTDQRLEKFTDLVGTAIANAESRAELAASEGRARLLAGEQAALRRVATLVAKAAKPDEVFDAVAQEVADVFGVELVVVCRYDPDAILILSSVGAPAFPAGSSLPLDVPSIPQEIHATGLPSRIDDLTGASGLHATARAMGVKAAVGAPIVVDGNVWGSINIATSENSPFEPDAEERLGRFTDLVATSVSSATMRAELAVSEARAHELAREQVALRRVATLVAKAAKPEEVFAAVAHEVADLFGVGLVTVCRYEPEAILVLSSLGVPTFPPESRFPLDVPSLPQTIHATGGAVRIDDFTDASGLDAAAREAGVKAAVGVPIVVDGNVWGSINVATTENAPLEPDAEERIGRFTDLIATSVSNATMRAELAASRARVLAAADDARRRIERDLHDGAQQQLVTLAIALQRAKAKVPPEEEELHAEVGRVAEGLTGALEELREMSRGIHPAVLAEGGLSPALKALGRRSPLRVKLDLRFDDRLPDRVEVAAYFTVSEALTNASKHANASRVWISLRVEDKTLYLSIRDDGAGGADSSRGSGLIGLKDRIEAVEGTIEIESPPGRGTKIDVEIPVPNTRSR